MLREYANNVPFDARGFIVQVGGYSLDSVAMGYKLRLPRGGPPVTNIRNTTSPHWRGWLKPENRCLVPFNSFAEYAPEPNPETKKKDVVCSR
jgi:putative SOS response-associated peptidase YedK